MRPNSPIEGAWRKLRKEFPESFQAATKLSVEDSRAQWTMHEVISFNGLTMQRRI
jgi:hypothetical protein